MEYVLKPRPSVPCSAYIVIFLRVDEIMAVGSRVGLKVNATPRRRLDSVVGSAVCVYVPVSPALPVVEARAALAVPCTP